MLPDEKRRRLHNFPAPATLLIGREREMEAVADRLISSDVRLLTLTGPGGVGKTRLALAIADRVLGQFPDGVFFVSLAPLRDPFLVAHTVGQSLGLREMGAKPMFELVKDCLQERRSLLLLDNFEPVVEAAPLIGELLAACPYLKVLVTSREALRLLAEHRFVVPPLGLPEETAGLPLRMLSECEAVRLFVYRARAVKSDFALTEENTATVAAICRRLDGLPLAIQLAAARLGFFSPQALLARMEHGLGLLTDGVRDLPVRQQTMHRAIAWSYDLLSDGEQKLFRRLAVFGGGCTMEAAEAVCNGDGTHQVEVPDGLESLATKSLLRTETAGESRFLMLETIREFAQEHLEVSGEAAEVRTRHADYFRRFARKSMAELQGPRQREAGDRLEKETNNLRNALRWSLEGGSREVGLALCASLGQFWNWRGHLTEGRSWLDRLLGPGAPKPSVAHAGALVTAAGMAWYQGDQDAAHLLLRQSMVESQALMSGEGDQSIAVRSLTVLNQFFLGGVALDNGKHELAKHLLEESVTGSQSLGMVWVAVHALLGLASMAALRGDGDVAISYCKQGLDIARNAGFQMGIGLGLLFHGMVLMFRRDHQNARLLLKQGLTIFQDIGERVQIISGLAALARCALALGERQRAARLFGAASHLQDTTGYKPHAWETPFYEETLVGLHALLSKRALAVATTEGQEMSLEQVIAYALEGGDDFEPTSGIRGRRSLSEKNEPLSEREQEVAVLVARGLTNRQIAKQLMVSSRTVDSHLIHILRKLNKTSRAHLAAWAARQGLLETWIKTPVPNGNSRRRTGVKGVGQGKNGDPN